MATYNIAEAKAKLSALVDQALSGEDVILAKDNKPLAKITALKMPPQPRKPGSAKGKIWIAPDFDGPLEDFEDYR